LITANSYSQDADIEILQKTIFELNKIETVFHQSTIEGIENGITYLENTNSIFFDFRGNTETPKYYLKHSDSELIYDGSRHIQSLTKEKLIVTNNSPNPNNPLLLTLYTIKELLPKMISNSNIKILRGKDTLINGKENFYLN
jgi:hypothetical protein